MKKLLFLSFALTVVAVTIAQQELATLDHDDTITVFYGPTALTAAYNAATNGDIITLTGGTFISPDNVNKAIAIRGAGMFPDTVAGTIPTIISGSMNIQYSGTSSSYVSLEGMQFPDELILKGYYGSTYVGANYLHITKCYIAYLRPDNVINSREHENLTFVNCILKKIRFRGSSNYTNGRIVNSTFANCIILELEFLQQINYHNTITNCIANISPSFANYFTINNCILYTDLSAQPSSSTSIFNSIGICSNSDNTFFDTNITNGQNLHNYNSLTDVFEDFNGSYNYASTTFRLKNNLASIILGSDGTQIGIYGGDVPFDPSVRNSMIGKLHVARRTNAEGKLEVNIDIIEQ